MTVRTQVALAQVAWNHTGSPCQARLSRHNSKHWNPYRCTNVVAGEAGRADHLVPITFGFRCRLGKGGAWDFGRAGESTWCTMAGMDEHLRAIPILTGPRQLTAAASRSPSTATSETRPSTRDAPRRSGRFAATHSQIAGMRGLDHNFVPNGEGFRTVAVLDSPVTRTRMEMRSDQPGLQVYTGNSFDGTRHGQP